MISKHVGKMEKTWANLEINSQVQCDTNNSWYLTFFSGEIQNILVDNMSSGVNIVKWSYHSNVDRNADPHVQQCAASPLIARFMGPTWVHLGPTGPRWAPCWPHELCYLGLIWTQFPPLNTLRPIPNCRHLQTTLSNAFCWMKMNDVRLIFHWSLILRAQINNIPALVEIMARCRPGDNPLCDAIMVSLQTHKCVNRLQ